MYLEFEENCTKRLYEIRQNNDLISEYSINIDNVDYFNFNHYSRQELLIALLNDRQETDYEVVKYLCREELNLRKSDLSDTLEIGNRYSYDVDNFYLAAYILCLFKRIEDIWLFIEAKTFDFDLGIGFDGEYVLSFGVDNVFEQLNNSQNILKDKAFNIFGKNKHECQYHYDEDSIKEWHLSKQQYFSELMFPLKNTIGILRYDRTEQRITKKQFTDSWNRIEEHFKLYPFSFKDNILEIIKQLREQGWEDKIRAGQSMYNLSFSRARTNYLYNDHKYIQLIFQDNKMKVIFRIKDFNFANKEYHFDTISLNDTILSLFKELEKEEIK
jgi:hypothetical protein